MIAGPGVDIVLDQHKSFPFEDASFDAIVSTSCFEHDFSFWQTASQMVRVARSGGYLYINAPSNGPYHGYPLDCWRFYADAGIALSQWLSVSGHTTMLIESGIANRINDQWNDFYAVLQKGDHPQPRNEFIHERVASRNIRLGGEFNHQNCRAATEDQDVLAALRERLSSLENRIEQLETELSSYRNNT